MFYCNSGTPEAQPATGGEADNKQAVGSKPQLTSGLHPNLFAVQQHSVSQAADTHQEPSCARCRDLRYVCALKASNTACDTAPLATQPAGLTAAKSAATTQNPAESAATATATASHAANSGDVIPAAAEASAQPASQTEADADAQAMGAKLSSTHCSPTADTAARMVRMSNRDATKPALQSAGAGSAGAESAGADSPAGSQPGLVKMSNRCRRKRKRKRRLSGGYNGVPGILPHQPAGPQPGPVQRTVSSKRREKEKRCLAGTFSSMRGIMQACVCNDTGIVLASEVSAFHSEIIDEFVKCCLVCCWCTCFCDGTVCKNML